MERLPAILKLHQIQWILLLLTLYAGNPLFHRISQLPPYMLLLSCQSVLLWIIAMLLQPCRNHHVTWSDLIWYLAWSLVFLQYLLHREPVTFRNMFSWIVCWALYGAVRENPFTANLKHILRTCLMLLGLTESVVVLLQRMGILRSLHAYYAVSGSFENPAMSGMFLCISLLAWCYRGGIVPSYSNWKKMPCIALILTALVLSDSRAAWLSAFVGMSFMYHGEICFSKSWHRNIAAVSLLVCLVGGSAWLYAYKQDSADGRLLIWRNTIPAVWERPVFGRGPNSFQRGYLKHQADYFSTHPHSKYNMVAGSPSEPFNDFLRIAYEYGLVELLLIAWGIVYIWRKESRLSRCILLATAVFSCFSYPLSVFRLYVFFPILFGLLPEDESSTMARHHDRMRLALCSVVSVAGICYMFVSYSVWRGISYDIEHRKPLSSSAYQQMKNDRILFMVYYQTADPSARRTALADAVALYPSPQFWCDYADACVMEGDTTSAIAWYSLAGLAVPSLLTPIYKQMELYMAANDTVATLHSAQKVLTHPVKKENTQTIRMKSRARRVMSTWGQ